MAREAHTESQGANDGNDASYDLSRLIRVSSAASLIAWFFALVGAIGLALAIYWAYLAVEAFDPSSRLVGFATGFVVVVFMLLLCFGSSIMMRAVSEGLMVLRDIEENTRALAEPEEPLSEASGA